MANQPTYKIVRTRHELQFKCLRCGHLIDVRHFSPRIGIGGNPRSQAAAAMKLHQQQNCGKPA